jgi:hypothetical protein
VRPNAKASFAGSTLGSGTRRGRIGLACLCVLGLAAFLGSSAPSAGAQGCPNDPRSGPSANLPDCRAYEMTSPPEKAGQQVLGTDGLEIVGPIAAQNGQTSTFNTQGAIPESVSSGLVSTYLTRRGASGWSYENISPPLEPYGFIIASLYFAFTPDLQKGVIFGAWNPPLTPDASEGTSNNYIRDLTTGAYRLLTPGLPPNEGEVFVSTRALSDDGSHVVFSSPQETGECGPPAASDFLCDWNAATGVPILVARAPVTNEPLPGVANIAGPGFSGQKWRRPISADGSHIFFENGGEGCGICVRINGATTQIVSPPGSTFQAASSDGSIAYVTDPASNGALERYDVNADVLTPITEAADEVQGVLGTSADGSRVYFVAKGELAPGATAGMNNLYLWTQGAGFTFIATGTTSSIFTNNYSKFGASNSRVTPDGMHLAFTANNSLTGYPDNGNSEAYLYSAATGALVCASCNPSGEPATSGAFITGTSDEIGYEPHNLSDDGRYLFFTTDEALVPRDVNITEDVYRYDAASGQLALISPGTDKFDDPFTDAGASGNNAFFVTHRPLVGIDEDEVADLYDARVGGGLASQNPPAPAAPCTGTECRGQSSSPNLAPPAAATAVGRGNVTQRQNCSKLGREAKKLSNRAKKLRRHAKQAKRNGKSKVAKKRNKKATRLAKRARSKSKSAKRCRKANRRASK